MTHKKIEHAQLNWRDEQPESTQFGDIYFSVEDGIAETEHVFIQSNQLPDRLAQLERRAQAVVNYLQERKINSSWLVANGYGETPFARERALVVMDTLHYRMVNKVTE